MAQINPYAYEGSSDSLATKLPGDRPTHARYVVLTMTVLMAVLMYLDRFALNVVQPLLMKQLSLSLTDMGWVTSAFFYVYALSQIPAGNLGDRWGARITLPLYVASWSIVFGLHSLATGFWMLIALRMLLGASQAGAYAVASGVVKTWIEPQNRGFASSAVSMGGRLGGVLTNWGTPKLMTVVSVVLAGLGWRLTIAEGEWRVVFALYACLGLIWAGVFYWWFRNSPEEHPGVSQQELATIRGIAPKAVVKLDDSPPPPWWIIFTNRNAWLLGSIMFLVNVGWIFLPTQQTTYLTSVFNLPLSQAGSYTAFTALAGMAGCLAGGVVTDWLCRVTGPVWGRRLPGLIACGGAATVYLCVLTLKSPLYVAIAFSVIFFLNDFLLGSLWATLQDIGNRNCGAIFGFVNMSGNLGAASFPPVIGMLVKSFGWNGVFVIAAAAFLIAMTAWFFVDPRLKLPSRVAA